VGAFLSGGIDSSTVTTIAAAEHETRLATFCIAFPEMHDQDIHYANLVASRLGTAHHERALRGDEARDLVLRMPAVLDEPLYDPSVYPTYLVSRLARESVKVALSGTGGDEVFAGYGWLSSQVGYAGQRDHLGALAAPLGAVFSRLLPLLRGFPPGNRLPGVAKILGPDQAARSFYLRGFFDAWDQRRLLDDPLLRPTELDDHLWLYRRFARPDWPLVPRLMRHDLKTLITDNELTLLDRATMAHGLEGRLPLLDHVLVERVLAYPWHYLFADGKGKRVLRAAVATLLPAEVLGRTKYGFSPPFKRWLREGALAETAAHLVRGRLVEDGVISARGMRRTLARGALRRLNKTWLLLNLEMWYRQWIRNEPAVPPGTPLNAL
jgi:asparagine synthase (glutamine-hydrolysing)